MASLERRGSRFRVKFRYGGRQFAVSLDTADPEEAEGLLGRLRYNLALLKRGHLQAPPDGDLGLFLLSDGKLTRRAEAEGPLTLCELFNRYKQRPTDDKEANTRCTEQIHMAHLQRLIGARQNVRAITTRTLQSYVDQRSQETGLSGPVSHATIRKEIGTFASIWNRWAVPQRLVTGPAPTKGLIYHKLKGKRPFQTWGQIERTIQRGGLSETEQGELWDALFLSGDQIDELLTHVKQASVQPWVYPMFVFAARTGARRSEMMRCCIDDIDFEGGVVRIREKKKDKTRDVTFRHVPLSPLLDQALREWLAKHPGGQYTFCQEAGTPLQPGEAAHQFERAIAGSRWKVLRGWHVLRHSFASNCAAAGVDQRVIDSWLGHQTDEMARRYRHLFPSQEKAAIGLVFGGK